MYELATGLFSNKGRVHLHICEPVNYEGNDIEELSRMIEHEILLNYKIWPTSHIAAKELSNEGYDFNILDENKLLKDRTFGNDLTTIISLASEYIKGTLKGVL